MFAYIVKYAFYVCKTFILKGGVFYHRGVRWPRLCSAWCWSSLCVGCLCTWAAFLSSTFIMRTIQTVVSFWGKTHRNEGYRLPLFRTFGVEILITYQLTSLYVFTWTNIKGFKRDYGEGQKICFCPETPDTHNTIRAHVTFICFFFLSFFAMHFGHVHSDVCIVNEKYEWKPYNTVIYYRLYSILCIVLMCAYDFSPASSWSLITLASTWLQWTLVSTQ